MADNMGSTGIVDKAVIFAVMKHSGSCRKGTSIPYIVHPMEAAAIVAGITSDQELIAAAVLHDTLEDTYTSFKELVEMFGKRVADFVKEESEDKQADRRADESWKDRKQATIDKLKKAPHESKILVLADKLANIRAMERDKQVYGDELWERFNQKDPSQHGWYYSSIGEILLQDSELKKTPACREYVEKVRAVFKIELEEQKPES